MLDTSAVRGTSRPVLESLQRRGFRLLASGLAVSELAVHRLREPKDAGDAEELRMRWSRVRALGPLLDQHEPFAPTHSALVSKLGGTYSGARQVPYRVWLANMAATWAGFIAPDPLEPELRQFMEGIAWYVEDTGRDFVETMGEGARVGGEQDDLKTALLQKNLTGPEWDRKIWLPTPPAPSERLDAWIRLLGLHGARAHARFAGQRKPFEPNHAIDLTMLQHLADGAIVVTQDYELIEEVDASGSFQAPWVRTAGELVLGRAPAGPPFSLSARRAHARHRQRRRAELAESDREGLVAAKLESKASADHRSEP